MRLLTLVAPTPPSTLSTQPSISFKRQGLLVCGLDLGSNVTVEKGFSQNQEKVGWDLGDTRPEHDPAKLRKLRPLCTSGFQSNAAQSSVPRGVGGCHTMLPTLFSANLGHCTLYLLHNTGSQLGGSDSGSLWLSPGSPAPCTWQQCHSGRVRGPCS